MNKGVRFKTGVIVQIENKTAHLLKNDGSFVSCPCNSLWRVGDVVTISRRSLLSLKNIIISFVALIILIIGSGVAVYNIPTTYIEISVNPSVQITLNRFDRVLSVKGLNDEGINLIQGVSYRNLTLDEAYARLLNRLENNSYLNDNTVQLVVANNSQRNLDGIEQTLRTVSLKYIETNNIRMSIKRYANDEYLALNHPLPVAAIPNAPKEESTEQPPEETQPQIETTTSLPENIQEPDNTPTQEADTTTTSPPTNAPTAPPTTTAPPSTNPPTPTQPPPTNAPNNNNNNNWNSGSWHNGWYHWDCNCAWCR